MTLDDLLHVPYVPNGRDPEGADCYGLARLARHHLYGKPLMASFTHVEGQDKRAMTRAQEVWANDFSECKPKAGAVAFCWRGRLCCHAAVVVDVDGRLMILETDEPGRSERGPRLVSLRKFEQRFARVAYYD